MHVTLDRIPGETPFQPLAQAGPWVAVDDRLTICVVGDDHRHTSAVQALLLGLGHRVEVIDSEASMDTVSPVFSCGSDLIIVLDISMETLTDILVSAPTPFIETPFWITRPDEGAYTAMVLHAVWGLLEIDNHRRRSYTASIDSSKIESQLRQAATSAPENQNWLASLIH